MRLLAALLLLAGVAFAQAPSVTPGASDRLLLKGHVVRPSGPITGEVLVVGNTIRCAAVSCSGAAGATIIDTQGIIFPGLIDAHNHAAFNMFDEADWNPGPIYRNHNQWPRNDKRYPQIMAAKKHLESSAGADLGCEMDKYGEIKALIAGTTSVLLAPKLTVKACFGSLARTIDTRYNDIDERDTIQTSISVPSESGAASVCSAIGAGTTKAYIVHVGEGVDETSRKEFDTLASRAGGCLLRKETTIIHGTAFGYLEFRKMALNDMALVWSPRSNMFLYKRADGQPATPRIDLAIQAGVKRIALGPDWALGGSMNLLDELRFAKKIATDNHWAAVSDERLFHMVTIDAARALGVADKLGSIAPGKRADLVVIAGDGREPFAALLKATPKTVQLVMVDGRIQYGDQALNAAAPSTPPCDALDVCGSPKFLCVAEASAQTNSTRRFCKLMARCAARSGATTGPTQTSRRRFRRSLRSSPVLQPDCIGDAVANTGQCCCLFVSFKGDAAQLGGREDGSLGRILASHHGILGLLPVPASSVARGSVTAPSNASRAYI